ncbi:xenotropic and polytropic retrovirus receptor 1 [Marchantia polymorpha subsp. ruderalis]|uniref:SPX domain-containing protein n=1 Tax=Marchantia polymorpha TaxID=3197 RepID=A0A2R6XAS4_MARPO|nr:hypothetical protein MARPO_0026s0066 [Marchantia polymorpha]BBN02132.1 hypothetical protein Mp_2g13060 [Marchantia polymorpha subsp. ruderalis]|eukprot:PTQ43188.1 hypothetical protein MARPO_0026s0066 [Marchantia polymorpha]
MVKFQKQLAGQLVPEWKEGYCDYKQLKRDVKRIKEYHQLVHVSMSDENVSKNSVQMLKSFGSPFVAFSDRLVNNPLFLRGKVENITVHIHQIRHCGSDDGRFGTELYETELLDSALTPTDLALKFFKKLDFELNRVNQFYKLKEEEHHLRAHSLQLQMAALLDLRRRQDSAIAGDGCDWEKILSSASSDEHKPEIFMNALKIQLRREAAVNKEQVQLSEKLLRTAFAEFYRGLGHLKSYSAMNIMAFSKILKKYDKVTGWNASLTYLRVVEDSYFASSDKVLKLMDGVENIFTLHLTRKNYREAMIYLRPFQKKTFRSIAYFQGVFTGCSVAFLSVLAATVMIPSPLESQVDTKGESVEKKSNVLFPLSSTVGLVLLHLYMYAWDMYLWRRARINYALIFRWEPGTELQYQEVLLLSTGFTTLWMLGMIVVKMYPCLPRVDLIPLFTLVVLIAILFLPLNICFRSTRMAFLRCMVHVVSSPFYKVVLADFFLADQLTSQVTVLKNIQYLACYYMGGHFQSHNGASCTEGLTVRCLQYVAILPYWWRLMQCARRWKDEHDFQQVLNGAKYLSALISTAMKVAYRQSSGVWLFAYVASSFISSFFGIYWDLVKDWGLMQSKSVNPWLRDHLLLKHKFAYYISIVVNISLRMAWLTAVLVEQTFDLDDSTIDAVLAVLEVIRRGHWNFYRLEYEHLHKFADMGALQRIPLPFQNLEDP